MQHSNEDSEVADTENIPSSPSFIENTPPSLNQKQDNLQTQEQAASTPRSRNCRKSSTSSSSSESSSTSTSSTSSESTVDRPGTSNVRSVSTNKNYCLSPATDDTDLSDNDPTFIENPRRISSTSSSSDADIPSSSTNNNLKTRKRKRNPSTWQQNKVKTLRNSGKSYVSTSKSKKVFSNRSMKGTCTSKCRLKCYKNVQEYQRMDLFQHYWALASLELQRAYIRVCLFEVQPKYKYTNATRPRQPNHAFFFSIDGNKIRVCKRFFLNTLDISDRQLRTVKTKTNSLGFVEPEGRGKHGNNRRVDPELVKQIKKHIESIPRIESHYLRANTSREFISDSKTISDLCTDFNNMQKEKNLPLCEYWLYLHTFNNEFNIEFFQPKKDRCETCVAYELAPEASKSSLKADYDKHLHEKELCRQEKRNDRRAVDETHICAVFDLQSVMLCPSPAYFYYSSKINCLDFTITELKNGEDEGKSAYGNVYCYFWDETQGQRGANEIGSCIFDYLGNLSRNNRDKQLHVTFYSDNCTGQNKNKAIASLYSYAVSHFDNIQSITHKYLIRGHTQNEADNVHSLIEKEIKKNEKSGPIYIPAQYATIIKSARKTGKPFIVKEVTFDFFLNLKKLQEQWGYNFNENTDKEYLLWKDLKVMKFLREQTRFALYYKTSYESDAFAYINMRNKRKKMLPFDEITLSSLYDEPIKIKENKKKDLKDLINKQLIPAYYAIFYNTL